MKKIVVGAFLIFGLIYLAYQEVKPTVLTFYFYMVSELTGKPNLAYEDRTDTLLGVDKNNNGIRDDIERYIDETVENYPPYVRDVYFMKARVLTETLKADANNENVAKKATKKWSDSVDCTIFINKIDFIKGGRLLRDLSSGIERLLTNTQKRKLKWRNVFRHHPSVIIGDNRDDVFINLERYCGITFERPYEVRAVWLYSNYKSNEKLARGHLEELKGKVNEDSKNDKFKKIYDIYLQLNADNK